jgi:hypothetical protein
METGYRVASFSMTLQNGRFSDTVHFMTTYYRSCQQEIAPEYQTPNRADSKGSRPPLQSPGFLSLIPDDPEIEDARPAKKRLLDFVSVLLRSKLKRLTPGYIPITPKCQKRYDCRHL